MKNKTKLLEITIMLCIASLFVILIHTSAEAFNYYDQGSNYNIIVFVFKKLISFAVPTFIFLSGFKLFYGDKDYKNKKYLVFLKNRFTKILIPYVVANIVYIIFFINKWNYEYNFFDVLVSIFLKGDIAGFFYFVIIIYQFYILIFLFDFLRKYIYSKWFLLFVFFVNVLFKSRYILNNNNSFTSFYNMYNDRIFMSYIFYFVLGMYFANNVVEVKKIVKNYKAWIFLYLIVVISHTYLSYINYMGLRYYRYAEFVHLIFCSLSIIALYIFSYKLKDILSFKLVKFINRYAALSYHIYLYHIFVMFYMEEFLVNNNVEKIYYSFPIKTLGTIVGSYIISRFIIYMNLKLKQPKKLKEPKI